MDIDTCKQSLIDVYYRRKGYLGDIERYKTP